MTTNLNLWLELFFLPWLVKNGLLPYRDFFDHHGFLLYYLLAPLTIDKTYFLLKAFYYLVQSINLILVLVILKRTTTKLAFFLGGLLFVLINYFIGENNLWYEVVITTFYLVIYLMMIIREFKYKAYVLGILIAFTSFIKPIAAIIIVPIFLIKRDFRMVISFFVCWMLVFLYFFFSNSLQQFIDCLFLFNNFVAKNYRPSFFSDAKFIASSIFLVCFSVGIAYKNKKLKSLFLSLSFLVSSLVFLYTGYGRWHLLPIMTFFTLLVVQVIGFKSSWYKTVFVIMLLVYTLLLARKVVYHHAYLNTQRIPWQENKVSREIVSALKNLDMGDKKLYIFSNHAEIYYALDKLPPTYFAARFPLTEKYFRDYEQRVISDLKKNKVEYIVVPVPLEDEYASFGLIRNFIKTNYAVKATMSGALIYLYSGSVK
jgi:hypothetical protein